MAISIEHPTSTLRRSTIETPPGTRLQQLVDSGTLYVAQNLNSAQFATLQAIASRILEPHLDPHQDPHHDPHHPERLAAYIDSALRTSGHIRAIRAPLPVAFDYQLGLDELDIITRTRTGYAFAELPAELQDAILSLISTGDITSRKLDIASWLKDLHNSAAAL